MGEIKRISIKEFREFGFLHEVNRSFFHPLGMALEVVIDNETSEERLGGIWDYRDDPEGIRYDSVDTEKVSRVADFARARFAVRKDALGYIIQPAGEESDLIEERLRSLGYME